jgi:hypothetical protein
VRAARTASRSVRARVWPASSGAVASRAVSRSSSADTWLDATVQPPAAWSRDSARRSSGTRTRANHATSSSAAVGSARHARRRRFRAHQQTHSPLTSTTPDQSRSCVHELRNAGYTTKTQPSYDDMTIEFRRVIIAPDFAAHARSRPPRKKPGPSSPPGPLPGLDQQGLRNTRAWWAFHHAGRTRRDGLEQRHRTLREKRRSQRLHVLSVPIGAGVDISRGGLL